jgi:hypothetical protein
MNNNFDELILKRRTRSRARTASMGAHVSWGTKGGRERFGGVDGGRGRGGTWGASGRGAQTWGCEQAWGRGARGARGGTNVGPWGLGTRGASGPWGAWGRERGGVNGRGGAWGTYGRGRPRPRGDHGNGAPTCAPPVGGVYGARTAAATWFVGARTYAPSNGGAHVSNEEGINGVTLLISRCQVFSSLLLA